MPDQDNYLVEKLLQAIIFAEDDEFDKILDLVAPKNESTPEEDSHA
jgi:hypothetical protein